MHPNLQVASSRCRMQLENMSYYLHLLPPGLWCLSSGLDSLPSALFMTNSWRRSGCSSVHHRFSVRERDRDLVLLGGGAFVVVAGIVVVAVAAVIHCALAFCTVSIMLQIIGSLIP